MACGFWDIKVPKVINQIADGGSNKIYPEGHEEEIIEVEDLQLGMRFHADMLNRTGIQGGISCNSDRLTKAF